MARKKKLADGDFVGKMVEYRQGRGYTQGTVKGEAGNKVEVTRKNGSTTFRQKSAIKVIS